MIRSGALVAVVALALTLVGSGATAASAKGLKKEKKSDPVVVVTTTHGKIWIELFPAEAPKTVKNFLELASGKKKPGKKFYDGLTFHRVISGFMLQGGCPRGDGTGGPGYQFEDEINADALGLGRATVLDKDGKPHPAAQIADEASFYDNVVNPLLKQMGIKNMEEAKLRAKEIDKRVRAMTLKELLTLKGYRFSATLESRPPNRGVLAMANSGPNTNGSQFFINLVDTPHLTGRHTVFGKVIKGMDVVDAIAKVKVDASARPTAPVKIVSIRRVGK